MAFAVINDLVTVKDRWDMRALVPGPGIAPWLWGKGTKAIVDIEKVRVAMSQHAKMMFTVKVRVSCETSGQP